MSKLLVKNGFVFDPFNTIEGETKDILIENGKIVDKFVSNNDVQEIDAKGKTVVPAAVEIHAHIASQQVNWVRLLGSENQDFQNLWNGLTLNAIAKNYISNGYTFILEANVFPSLTKQTIFDLKRLPVLDKAFLLNTSNLWALELEYQKEMVEEGAVFLSNLLEKVKGFGLKAYNPFESEYWNWKVVRKSVTEKGRLFNFTPMDVYEKLLRFSEHLGLPHSIHAHIEGYESQNSKENLFAILNKVKALGLKPNPKNNFEIKRSQIFHLAHGSSYNIDGDNSELIKFYNENQDFDMDLGFIAFNALNPLITSDRHLINKLINSTDTYKLIRSSVESEGDSFATLRKFSIKKKEDCILWANAIDLTLNISPWQLQFSVNYPNYADIKNLPEIASWLISNKAREQFMTDMDTSFLKDNSLISNGKELTFNDFIILTRSSPAKSLGIGSIKGNLGLGADGDLNILNLNLNDTDFSRDYEKFKSALGNIEYVIKTGEVIKDHDKINLNCSGKVFWASGKPEKEDPKSILTKKEDFYQKYNSNFYDSYNITINKEILRKIV
ncbi:MAG: amidohydrolase family protein [Candidatus Lokiarchaeota archaeon]|nr:amidohydrolase family protein [Candidatus Lokiarchaeota archaeon]